MNLPETLKITSKECVIIELSILSRVTMINSQDLNATVIMANYILKLKHNRSLVAYTNWDIGNIEIITEPEQLYKVIEKTPEIHDKLFIIADFSRVNIRRTKEFIDNESNSFILCTFKEDQRYRVEPCNMVNFSRTLTEFKGVANVIKG